MLRDGLSTIRRDDIMNTLYTIEGFNKTDICHWGIKGQKKGTRRFRNLDGSLTAAGKIRYATKKVSILGQTQGMDTTNMTNAVSSAGYSIKRAANRTSYKQELNKKKRIAQAKTYKLGQKIASGFNNTVYKNKRAAKKVIESVGKTLVSSISISDNTVKTWVKRKINKIGNTKLKDIF